jgi:hypothetical protein
VKDVEQNMKILAVGDVHTKQWMLYEIAELVDLYDHVVFVGDYADNFNTAPTHSLATWRLLKQLVESNPKKVHAVIGNHDYAYIHPEIAGRSSGWHPVTFTLLNDPNNKALKKFLLSLPYKFELDGVTFSHAGITNEWDGDEGVYGLWNDASPIWARPPKLGGNVTYKNIPQVIGHNPSETIWNPEPHVWCIDTFSETPNNESIGDKTVLEIIDGKEFNIININEILNDNSDTTSVEDDVS